MARALCTSALGAYGELLEVARPSFEEYAGAHGFELIAQTTPITDLAAPWEKIRLTRELLDSYSEVLWVDSDAVIVDASRDIFAGMGPDRGFGLVMHLAANLLPNTGVLALRSQPAVLALLDEIWRTRERYLSHIWLEQAALCEALGFASYGDGLMRLARPTPYMLATEFLNIAWNSIPVDQSWTPYVKHYPSLPHDARLRAMQRDSQLVMERHRAPAHAVAVVCVTHASSTAEMAQLHSAIADFPEDGSVQFILVSPVDRPATTGLADARANVQVVSADGPPDSLLLPALPLISAKVVIAADRALPVTPALISAVDGVLSSRDDIALWHRLGEGELLAFHRHHLPVAGWMSNSRTAQRSVLEPAMLALQSNGVRIGHLG